MDRDEPHRRKRREPMSANPPLPVRRDLHRAAAAAAAAVEKLAPPPPPPLPPSPVPPLHAESRKIRTARDSNDLARWPRRAADERRGPSSAESEHRQPRFTVANVGAGGRVYLKPSRLSPIAPSAVPTPPATRDGVHVKPAGWPRDSNVSGTWTPQGEKPPTTTTTTTTSIDAPVPPLPPAIVLSPRQSRRSHSFSEASRSPTFDDQAFKLLLNDGDVLARPRSYNALSNGLLDLHIPHYRLGTPVFGDRGTAYLASHRNSIYTASAEVPSSIRDYETLFPSPPGHKRPGVATQQISSSPGNAHIVSQTSPPPLHPDPVGAIVPAIFERLETDANSAAQIRYDASGRILAATPARLIAHITSPQFLNYELLSDFFLSYRCFMTSAEVLEYLIARMQWALRTASNSGQIVRVRTFVALRHWILNYFRHDFIPDPALRQRFCDLVNALAQSLYLPNDERTSDLNIIGELKKCWRRTCALHWAPDGPLDEQPDADLSPGGIQQMMPSAPSILSLPLTVRPTTQHSTVFDLAQGHMSRSRPASGHDSRTLDAFGPTLPSMIQHLRTSSIPASPLSEESLEVLSCSVPFLRNVQPHAHTHMGRRYSRVNGQPQTHQTAAHRPRDRPGHAHQRSGSFSDALRDQRAHLHANQPDSADSQILPTFTLTGGLVRGKILQPSPPELSSAVPLSPVLHTNETPFPGIEETFGSDRHGSNHGVKKIVGDVRRALSSRISPNDPLARGRQSDSSSGSRPSASRRSTSTERRARPMSQQPPGPPRHDALAVIIEHSYQEALGNAESTPKVLASPTFSPLRHKVDSLASPHDRSPAVKGYGRPDSSVTASSQSILIVDATGSPRLPSLPGALPSLGSVSSGMAPMPLFRSKSELLEYALPSERLQQRSNATQSTGQSEHSSLFGLTDARFDDLLLVPAPWSASRRSTKMSGRRKSESFGLRKSSSVHPAGIDLAAVHQQLRRRPGGDLRAADHVHDLQTATRPFSAESYSFISPGVSTVQTDELDGTRFSSTGLGTLWSLRSDRSNHTKVQPSLDLLDTEAGRNKLRPSFEAEASRLRDLPDQGLEGGIEDALLKLEGRSPSRSTRYDAPRSLDLESSSIERPWSNGGPLSPKDPQMPIATRPSVVDNISDPSPDGLQNTRVPRASSPVIAPPEMIARLSRYPISHPYFGEQASLEQRSEGDDDGAGGVAGQVQPDPSQRSFLLEDNQSLSDISTEIADPPDNDDAFRSFFFDDTRDEDSTSHRQHRRPVTPPPSMMGALSDRSPPRSLPPRSVAHFVDHPLKEAASAPKLSSPVSKFALRPQFEKLQRLRTSVGLEPSIHMPFVLAFDSEVVAEQLTIIEKDALDEVDWKDLIGMKWNKRPPPVQNWVEYLSEGEADARGIDMVIARFNLVVKWVISEIMLIEAPSERARAITKYVHMGVHTRRLRNYASMYQITLALLSSRLARLRRTWALVAPRERRLLEQLETLCRPLHNFHNLRVEMEAAPLEQGCIPFIGLYTHDLMFNAQKPGRIDVGGGGGDGDGDGSSSSSNSEPLVNFERYQTAATIIKSLLRLIEASGRYTFRPHPEGLSRCLWIAALDDVEMEARSTHVGDA